MPDEIETTICRVVLEASHNTLKHARAPPRQRYLERRNKHAVAIVEDDGIGFDAETAISWPPPGRLGLLGMRERVASVGGRLEVKTRAAVDTTVFARIPLFDKSRMTNEGRIKAGISGTSFIPSSF